jgi:hypothetical protein
MLAPALVVLTLGHRPTAALVPLVLLTRDRRPTGDLVNRHTTTAVASAAAAAPPRPDAA